jgi:hypothetical protein
MDVEGGQQMITFIDYLIESDEIGNISEEEMDQMAEELSWDDIADLYDLEDLVDEEITEALSASSRLRKGMKMKSRRTQMAMARKMKLRRTSDIDTLKKRAKLAARRSIMKRFLKGRDKKSLSPQEKDRLEKQIRSMPTIVMSLSTKMLPKIRDIEKKRLAGQRSAASSAGKSVGLKKPKLKVKK